MRHLSWSRRTARIVSTSCCGAVAATAALAAPSIAGAAPSDVAEIPVSFQVKNVNQSKMQCLTQGDGKTYTIRGHLTGTEAALSSPDLKAVGLYTHGHGYSEFFWNFKDVPGYNYVQEQAKKGLVSVSIDKLGYGESSGPDGKDVCFGVDATVQHQVIQQLRKGDYEVEGRSAPKFSKVALIGHSQGGSSAEVEAYSFDDIDALAELTLFDLGYGPGLVTNFGINLANCLAAPLPQNGPGSPGGYGFREITDQQYRDDNFFNADDAVIKAATARRTKDPCGYPMSASLLIPTSNALVGLIKVPVHLVEGDHDSQNIGELGVATQLQRFPASKDVTGTTLKNTGQALTLEKTAPQFRDDMATWLTQRGFSTPQNGTGTGAGTTKASTAKATLRLSVSTPKTVARGKVGSFKVRITNTSRTTAASGVRLRATAPKGSRLTGARTRSVGTIAAGRSKTVTVRIRTSTTPKSLGRVKVRATASNTTARSGSTRLHLR